ncbi:MAG TPA: hypothetical protein VFG63_11885 [Nocardioidaceae bacterium]|nr:hypothetical protein [Nocardioidaceae bacterium]
MVRSPRLFVLVGVLALVLAGFFGYLTYRDAGPSPSAAEPAQAAAKIHTDRFVSRAGGFSVQVPEGLRVTRQAQAVKLVSADKDLVVVVGPGEKGKLGPASDRFLDTMRERYQHLTLLGTKPERVDGRRALTSYGRATNANDVQIRFVVVVVRAQPRNYTIAAYTAFGSDPATVLPRVNAVLNGFRVRSPNR